MAVDRKRELRKLRFVRSPRLWRASVVGVALTLGALPVAAADPSMSCRGQVILSCDKTCQAEENMPADVELDFAAKTGSFCRGEQCDDGILEFTEQAGQWDSAPYRIFTLSSSKFTVSGTVSMSAKTFFADTDVGTLFGGCETEPKAE